MELGKIPPHDVEAEQAILGSMLTDSNAVVSALEVLKPESFYREDNTGWIYYKVIQTKFMPDVLYHRQDLLQANHSDLDLSYQYYRYHWL